MATMMRAPVLTAFGGPECLVIGERPVPEPRENQMRVRVAACGICGADLLRRAGHFPNSKPPCVIGHEIAGQVDTVGPLVTRFKPGDRVALVQRFTCGVCRPCREGRENLCKSGPGFYGAELSGGYGEYVIAGERNAVALPGSIPYAIGAILSCAVGTGLHALGRIRLSPGDSIGVTAASGGVGIHTIMLARLMGLRVLAVTSAASKVAPIRAAGADAVVVAADGKYHRDAAAFTDGAGLDAVVEIGGARSFESSLRALGACGRMVVVGNMEPGTVPFNPAVSILKEIEIVGSAHASLADLVRVVDLVKEGRIKPQIARILPVESAREAHAWMSGNDRSGRVVLTHAWAAGERAEA